MSSYIEYLLFSRTEGAPGGPISGHAAYRCKLNRDRFCYQCETKEGNIRNCTRCYTVMYCSVECQRKDFPDHKIVCKKIQAHEKEMEDGLTCCYVDEFSEIAELFLELGREKFSDVLLKRAMNSFGQLREINYQQSAPHFRIPFLLLDRNRVGMAYRFLKMRQLKAEQNIDYDLEVNGPVVMSYLGNADILEDFLQIKCLVHEIPTLAAFSIIKAHVIQRSEASKQDFANFEKLLNLAGNTLLHAATIRDSIRRHIGLLDDEVLEKQKAQLRAILQYTEQQNPKFLATFLYHDLWFVRRLKIKKMVMPTYINFVDCAHLVVRNEFLMSEIRQTVPPSEVETDRQVMAMAVNALND